MRLCALLSHFDEDPAWLTACVSSLALANVDHLIAVDGPYLLYPDSLHHHRSSLVSHQAIMAAAHGIDIALTLHTTSGPWMGNEIEKRNYMFTLARTALDLTDNDWFLIIDSDEQIERGAGLKQILLDAEEDVAYYRLLEADGTPNAVRGLYRYHPQLCLTVTHYGYRHGQHGQLLWDGGGLPAADATTELILRHHQRDSHDPRFVKKWQYNQARDEHQIERIPA